MNPRGPIHTHKLIFSDSEDMSVSFSIGTFSADNIYSLAVEYFWENGVALVGGIHLEDSIDGVHWRELGIIPVTGASGSFLFSTADDIGPSFLRAEYLAAAGTGNFTATYNVKNK